MKEALFEILENRLIAANTYLLRLAGDTTEITRPGQFVNIRLAGFFLRRPLSVCDWDENTLCLIYKAVGAGTRALSGYVKGTVLDLLCGLGNGYDTLKSGAYPLLIGGGAGIPPMYALCKRLIAEGKKPAVILGFNTENEVFWKHEFSDICKNVVVVTADGSYGKKGLVTDIMDGLPCSYFYTCGPQAMLRAVYDRAKTDGQFSFEERMGCGFGACMGCTCKTKYGNKRICKDGPVLEKAEIIW